MVAAVLIVVAAVIAFQAGRNIEGVILGVLALPSLMVLGAWFWPGGKA
jgi:hypothetical protein